VIVAIELEPRFVIPATVDATKDARVPRMPRPLTVLLTNIAFAFRSGTEIVIDQVARGLLRRGHRPIVFAPYVGGGLTEGLRKQGIAVINSLKSPGFEPDIIQGQHNVATVMALAAFPNVRALFWCHDFAAPKDQPPLVSRIRRFLAVDEACHERLLLEHAPSERTITVYNAVDLELFKQRSRLPENPKRLLCLTKGSEHIVAVQEASFEAGLEFETLGGGVGQVVDDLAKRLHNYDIVVATARMAMEAVAVGCAVIVCDDRGFAGLVTTENLREWRRKNFGRQLLQHQVSVRNLVDAIRQYDPSDATMVTEMYRQEADLERQIDQLEEIYQDILSEPYTIDSAEDLRSLAPFLEDFLISLDFTRSWAALYANVTGEPLASRADDPLLRRIELLNSQLLDRYSDGNLVRQGLSLLKRAFRKKKH